MTVNARTFALTAERFARFLHVITGLEEGQCILEDNYFDLSAGQRREITVEAPRRLEAAEIAVGHWLTEWL